MSRPPGHLLARWRHDTGRPVRAIPKRFWATVLNGCRAARRPLMRGARGSPPETQPLTAAADTRPYFCVQRVMRQPRSPPPAFPITSVSADPACAPTSRCPLSWACFPRSCAVGRRRTGHGSPHCPLASLGMARTPPGAGAWPLPRRPRGRQAHRLRDRCARLNAPVSPRTNSGGACAEYSLVRSTTASSYRAFNEAGWEMKISARTRPAGGGLPGPR